MRILVVDDDAALCQVLTQCLSGENYAIDTAQDGQQGWAYISTYDYDLIILDVVMPKLDGVNICKRLRAQGNTVPILLLTAQDSQSARLTGWEAGADDYVVKPFDQAELAARIRALLRRSRTNPLPILTWGALWLNSNTNEALYDGQELALTAKEYGLLEMMLRDSQHVFSTDEIMDSLWSSEEFPADATVRSHVRRLRNKLSSAGAPPDFITTAHGHGYYLKEIAESPLPSMLHEPDLTAPTSTNGSSQASSPKKADKQAQYQILLNQTWQQHQGTCLEKVAQLQQLLVQLAMAQLTPAKQTEAYRLAHTLSGTLGTFGLKEAMQLTRQIEQEIHPDLHLESSQSQELQILVNRLEERLQQTHTLPGMPTISPSSSDPSPVRVMVVDDDPIFLQTVLGQLRVNGFDVTTLDNPTQFWPVLEQIHPDVLLLDIQMPQMNGLDLCKKVRSTPTLQQLPVMFLSILSDAQTQHRAFAVGADDYLAKPITGQQLSERIRLRLQRIWAVSAAQTS